MQDSWRDKIGKTRWYSEDYEERTDIVLWDVMKVEKEQLLKIAFIRKNSQYRQGFRLAVDVGSGVIECNDQAASSMMFWEDTAPKEFVVKCVSPEGLLSVYNIWDEGDAGGQRSQMYCSGMIVQEEGNKTIYYCHDVGKSNASFDKIVFSIEKLENETPNNQLAAHGSKRICDMISKIFRAATSGCFCLARQDCAGSV